MPYEYRKLSAKERQEIVEVRKQRGYPLHSPPHPFREAGSYLITAANFEHKPIMAAPERRAGFQKLLLSGFQEIGAEIVGWVILPNHYHILANVESLDAVSGLLKHIHGSTSHAWNLQDSLAGNRKVWLRFSDYMMRSDEQFYRTLNYIHNNPVKHGQVENVYDWAWSSLFMYVDEMGEDWLRETWKKYKPDANLGKGWDW